MLIFFFANEKNGITLKYPDKEVPMPDSVPMIRMSDVQQTAVHWLWYPYIPFGKLDHPARQSRRRQDLFRHVSRSRLHQPSTASKR